MKNQDRMKYIISGFDEIRRFQFLQHVLQFGIDFKSVEDFWTDLCTKKPEYFQREHKKVSLEVFKKYLKQFYITLICRDYIQEQENIMFCGIDPEQLVKRITAISILKKKYQFFKRQPAKFKI
jgi:hypothetical protein